MRAIVAAATLLAGATAAQACSLPGRYVSNVEYLACLLDEHVKVLNEHADIINDHARRINRLTDENEALREALSRRDETLETYARKVVGLEIKVDEHAESLAKIEEVLRNRGVLTKDSGFFWAPKR